jgi:hypothetical protein
MQLFFTLLILTFLYLFHISKNKLFALTFLALVFISFAEWIYLGDFTLVKKSYVYDSVSTSNIKEINYFYDFIPYENLYPIANGFLWLGYALIIIAITNETYKLFTGKYLI